jgi:hypothetical protein
VEVDLSSFVTELRSLIDDYRAGAVPVDVFESRFLALHSEMPISTPSTYSRAVEDLFWAVESFVAAPELRGDGDLDESGLRSAVEVTAAAMSDAR